MSRQNLSDIIVNDLQAEYDEIYNYRLAIATGVDDYNHSLLDDTELTDALLKVIEYYKTKHATDDIGDIQLNFDYDSDDAYYNPFKDGFDSKYVPDGIKD